MIGWIVAGTLLLSVAVLWVVITTVLGRLRPLRRAVRRMNIRAEQAQQLQESLEGLQTRVLGLQQGLAEATTRAETLRSESRSADHH